MDLEKYVILPLVQAGEDDFVSLESVREITTNGLDRAQPEDRCMAWLILLGIYPKRVREWTVTKEELITSYQTYVETLELTSWHTKSFPAQVIKQSDFQVKDNALMALIHGDIVRTGRHIYLLPPAELDSSVDDSPINLYAQHLRRLERILYVLGSVNPAMSYMQGFNELLLPLYYTFFQGRELFSGDVDVVEALSFHSLHHLLGATKIGELFMTQDKSTILLNRLDIFHEIVKVHVPDVYEVLHKLNITPVIYCYRWFSLLFSQEYEMPALQQIWDALFTHFDDLVDFAFHVGAAQIEMVKDITVFPNDYAATIEAIQGTPVRDIYQLLNIANTWWRQTNNPTAMDIVQVKFKEFKTFMRAVPKVPETLAPKITALRDNTILPKFNAFKSMALAKLKTLEHLATGTGGGPE